MADPRKGRSSKRGAGGEGLKDPKASCREHVASKTLDPKAYQSIIDQEDLSFIRIGYCIQKDFELELPSPNIR